MLRVLLNVLLFTKSLLMSESRESVLINGRKYSIVKEPPKNPECKGYEILLDDNGAEYCMAKTTDPQTSSRIEYDYSQYADCGRENLPDKNGARIIGGSPVEGVRFPWLAHLNIKGGTCTGSILSSRVIVFAAHCVQSRLAEATVGLHSLNNRTRVDTYKGFITMLNYNPKYDEHGVLHLENDVAVMTTFRTIEFNKNVGPICLPQAELLERLNVGTPVTAVGYGTYKSFESLIMKYNLITTKQIEAKDINEVSIEEIRRVSYQTFIELLPYLPEILDKNFKVLKEYTPDLIAKFADKNIEKLNSTMLTKISDESDKKLYLQFLRYLIKFILQRKYDDKKDFEDLVKDIRGISITAKVPQIMQYNIISTEPCVSALREYNKAKATLLCLKTTEKASICGGDSGGPGAVVINGLYYLVGIATMSFDSLSIPLQPQCTISQETKETETLAIYEDVKWQLPLLKEMMEKAKSMEKSIK